MQNSKFDSYANSNTSFSEFPETASEMKLRSPNGLSEGVKPEVDEKNDEDANPTFVSKAGPLFLPRFFVEVLAVAALSALAYYLRFNDGLLFQPYFYPVPCEGYNTQITAPKNYYVPYSVTRDVFLYVLFAAPIGVMLLGETIRWALGIIATKMVMIGKCPVGQSLRRSIRFIGCFYTGIVLTSIITDMLQLFISRPSPTFLEICLGNKPCTTGFIVLDQDFKNCPGANATTIPHLLVALRAFPSYRATMSAYAATYGAWYLHFLFGTGGTYVLRPFLATGAVALAMMPSLSDWAELRVSWEDVAVGLAIGTAIGVYMVCNVNWFVEEHDDDIMRLATLQAVIRKQVQTDNMLTNPEEYVREPPIRKLLPRIQAVNPVYRQSANGLVQQSGLQRSNTMPVNRNFPANELRNSAFPLLQRQPQSPIYAYGTSKF